MIYKKTEREFDSEFNEWDKWPMDLTYRVYCMIIDDVNKALEDKENEEVDDGSGSTDSDSAE